MIHKTENNLSRKLLRLAWLRGLYPFVRVSIRNCTIRSRPGDFFQIPSGFFEFRRVNGPVVHVRTHRLR